MYAWIWRKLPFGLRGKLITSIGMILAVGALLWFVVFPWLEPLAPFDDVQVGNNGDTSQFDDGGGVTNGEDPSSHPGDDNAVPYDTESNNPPPSGGR